MIFKVRHVVDNAVNSVAQLLVGETISKVDLDEPQAPDPAVGHRDLSNIGLNHLSDRRVNTSDSTLKLIVHLIKNFEFGIQNAHREFQIQNSKFLISQRVTLRRHRPPARR
jgi:hypothetical protein